jgi:high-affinity nickel permease
MTLFPALAFGFVLGVRHSTDADHLAAVATIATRQNAGPAWRTALVGAWWGAGHSLSVLLVGGALVLMRAPMPARLALILEFGVGLMLVALGIASMRQRQRAATALRPFLIGTMHGLAGSAVIALLLIGTTTSSAVAAAYLLCFCIGTVAGMALISTLMAIPARLRPSGSGVLAPRIRFAAGVASVVMGLVIAHRVGIREGLFAATLPLP